MMKLFKTMKKTFLILFITIFLSSCCDLDKSKYHRGDTVYIKPDSTCGTVEFYNDSFRGCGYKVKLENGKKVFVLEKDIY